MSKLEIYSRSTKTDQNYGFGETIKTQINQLSIIPILSDSIYKDPLSAIRELYANEITACKNSKLKCNIEIKLDTNSRDLTIQGFNSIGITREVFDKILSVMGNSGNNDGKKSGMFGLGFFSHVKLSEKMIIHTYSQDEKYFSFISKSGLSFEILPLEFTEKLSNYGTKLILNIKDTINLDELTTKIKEIIKFSVIKTDFFVDAINENVKQYGSLKEILKDNIDIWTNKKKYNSVSTKIYQNSTDLYDIIIFRNYPNDQEKNLPKSYLLNMPISLNLDNILSEIKDFDYYRHNFEIYINVKDESVFIPHVSRDYFTKESEIKLAKLIIPDIENFHEYPIPIIWSDKNQINIMDFINDKNRFFTYTMPYFSCKGINEKYMEDNFKKCIVNIFNRLPENYIIKGICFIGYSNKKLVKQLYDFGFLCFQHSKKDDPNDYFIGITTIQDALKQNGIKSKIGTINRKSKKVFKFDSSHQISFKIKHKDPENINKYDYKNIGFTFLDNSDAIEINEIPLIFKDKIFFTTEGYKTLNQLKDYNLIFTKAIFKKYIPIKAKTAFITSKIDIQLISIFYDFKDYHKINVFSEYLESKLMNDKIKNFIYLDIIKTYNVNNIDQLNGILKIC